MKQDEKPSRQTWLQRVRDRLNNPQNGDRAEPAPAQESRSVETLISDRDIESLKRAYLQRLYQRSRTLYIYGLDARRQALQARGQTLDLQAIYTPLNTTLPALPEPSSERPALAPRDATDALPAPHGNNLSALEAIGSENRAILRGSRGSGKSTLVRFLASTLAQRSLGRECVGLARLGPTWMHGCPFPVWVDLRAFGGSPHNDGTEAGLSTYIAETFNVSADQLRDQILEAGGLLLMLDGIEMALDAVAGFYRRFAQTPNRFLLTTQPFVDLTGKALRPLQDLAEITLAPWTLEQMDQFTGRWYAELAQKEWIDPEAARDLPGQLSSILRRKEVMALGSRPSLMTLIALLHTTQSRFPAGRVAFYRQLIGLCITRWTEGRAEQERDMRQVFDVEMLRAALAEATYNRYARLKDPAGQVAFSGSDLRTILIAICCDGRIEAADALVTRMRTRPGYLDERSADVYVYSCPDLQVHAAAQYLAAQPELPRLALALAHEDYARWREVILLAGIRLAQVNHDLPAALELVDALCHTPVPEVAQKPPLDIHWQLAWLAGETMAEISQEMELLKPLATLERIESWLVALLDRGQLIPAERARAGSVLDRLPDGDRRPGVSSFQLLWCPVPAGNFWQGRKEATQLEYVGAFSMSRYPITNAQYAAFVQATGNPPPAHWQGEHPPAGTLNHPVVQVTWKQASQYCAWYTTRLFSEPFLLWRSNRTEELARPPDDSSRDWVIRLPTSQEWEKTARGGLQIPGDHDELQDNPFPTRAYPWNDTWQLSEHGARGDETRCNVSESHIGTTTPVGMYPDGASPYGVMDMAGNVWEWCLDWAGKDNHYKIRRGGAYRFTHEHARCAAFDQAHPGLGWPHLGFRVALAPPKS